PDVSDSYEIAWRAPDVAKLKEMLCEEHEFAEERVCNALERSSVPKVKQGSIEQWL
ncbi:hypothetical protein C5S35_00870, partial [Candidatus Methanophagaceae archaeon]